MLIGVHHEQAIRKLRLEPDGVPALNGCWCGRGAFSPAPKDLTYPSDRTGRTQSDQRCQETRSIEERPIRHPKIHPKICSQARPMATRYDQHPGAKPLVETYSDQCPPTLKTGVHPFRDRPRTCLGQEAMRADHPRQYPPSAHPLRHQNRRRVGADAHHTLPRLAETPDGTWTSLLMSFVFFHARSRQGRRFIPRPSRVRSNPRPSLANRSTA